MQGEPQFDSHAPRQLSCVISPPHASVRSGNPGPNHHVEGWKVGRAPKAFECGRFSPPQLIRDPMHDVGILEAGIRPEWHRTPFSETEQSSSPAGFCIESGAVHSSLLPYSNLYDSNNPSGVEQEKITFAPALPRYHSGVSDLHERLPLRCSSRSCRGSEMGALSEMTAHNPLYRTRTRWPGLRLLERRSLRFLICWMEAPYLRAMSQRVSPCRTVW